MSRSERVAAAVVALLALVALAAHLSPDPHNTAQRRALAERRALDGDWRGAVELHLANAHAARDDGAGRVDSLVAASKVALEAEQQQLALSLYLEASQIYPQAPPMQLSRYGVELYVAIEDYETALERARTYFERPGGHEDLALLELVVGASSSTELAALSLGLLAERVQAQPEHRRLAELTCRTLNIAPFPDSLHDERAALAAEVSARHPQLDCEVREPQG
jgi:hypothetical protein